MQGSPRTRARHADDGVQGLPCILVIEEAVLAADLITQLIFKHLEQNLATDWEGQSMPVVDGHPDLTLRAGEGIQNVHLDLTYMADFRRFRHGNARVRIHCQPCLLTGVCPAAQLKQVPSSVPKKLEGCACGKLQLS